MRPAMLGLDWGISDFRAYALGADGSILRRHAAGAGIMRIADGGFEAVLRAEIGGWLDPDLPVLASGMITSRQGWHETSYVRAPAGVAELAAALQPLRLADGVTLHFVPGVDRIGDDGVPDVMRGEETQILGAMPDSDSLLVLPGSHSKWVLVTSGRIVWFATFITGELYAALKEHTILGRLMTPAAAFDADAYENAAAKAVRDALELGGMSRQLFSVRTLGLFGRLPPSALADFLSGLLIGSEVADAERILPEPCSAAMVVGNAELTDRYQRVLKIAGMTTREAPADVAAAGLYRLALAAGLLAGRA